MHFRGTSKSGCVFLYEHYTNNDNTNKTSNIQHCGSGATTIGGQS